VIANIFFTLVNTYILGNVAGVNMILPTWAIIIIAGIGLLILLTIAMIFEHKYTLPSFMTYWNHQWWYHGNPLPAKVEGIEKSQTAMQQQLDRIEKLLTK
jgi:amino acid transporter